MEAVEIALITALMAVVIIAGIQLVGDGIFDVMNGVMTVINGAGAGME